MILGDYLVILGSDPAHLIARAHERYPHLTPIFTTSACTVLAGAGLPHALLGEAKGALLGIVHGPDAAAVSGGDPARTAFPQWEAVMRDNVGDFLVVGQDVTSGALTVARSALGQLPCYHAAAQGLVLLSNAARIIKACGVPLHVDEKALVRHLFNINARASTTCLLGLAELEAGHCLTFAPNAAPQVRPYWDPWRYAGRSGQSRDMDRAPHILRARIIEATRRACLGSRHVLLGLSGGLDSSILAASLDAAGVDFSCFTLVTPDGSGDERRFARLVAGHLGRDLHEIVERPDDIDIAHSAARDLPRPVSRCFAQSGDKVQMALAHQLGADAFMSGGGGDNSFCYVHSARPLADRLLCEGPGLGAWRTARDIALLTDSPQWRVMMTGARRALTRRRDYHWPISREFLSAQAQEICAGELDHPWMHAPAGQLPGKAQHVAWILGVLNHLEGFERERKHRTLWPLLAQPVVEHCLSIPTYAWIAGGQNRIIARQAFSDLLPAEIVDRRSKGSPDAFVIKLFEERRLVIRDHLCGGWLAARGLIDVDAIAAVCTREIIHKDVSCWNMFRLVDAESWARAWDK